MLFYLFCMFHYYWRIIHRSQKSDGKSIVWTPYFWRSAVRGKYAEGLIFPDDGASQKGRPRRAAMGPPHRPARPLCRRAATWWGGPRPPRPSPSRVLLHPETLRSGGSSRIVIAASSGWKTPERKELSGRQKSAGEIPFRRGEIVAIVTVIELDFIGIIIIIISTTDTVISTAAPRLRCNI